MFTPFKVKSVTIPNRVVMPPMCMYSATEDGLITDWHLVHYGSRAVGSRLDHPGSHRRGKRGRLSGNDLGIWDDGHIEGLRRIVEVCQAHGSAVGIQIAHAGRKAWGDELVAPSALAFPGFAVPHALSREEIKKLWSTGVRLPGGPRPQVLMSCKFTGPMDT